MTKLSIIVVLSALALLSSCKKEGSDTTTKTATIATKETLPKLPKPLKVYSNDTVSVNAYDFKGLEYYLKQQNDTTYVVNFWATWCVPCVAELPNFEKAGAKYKNGKVKVILVSLDMAKMIDTKLLPFIYKNKLQSRVLVLRDPDADAWIPKVDSTWSGAIPATVIYNKGKRKFYERSFTFEELDKEITNFNK